MKSKYSLLFEHFSKHVIDMDFDIKRDEKLFQHPTRGTCSIRYDVSFCSDNNIWSSQTFTIIQEKCSSLRNARRVSLFVNKSFPDGFI